MEVRQSNSADPLDLYHNVLVVPDAAGVALVARECSRDYSDAVTLADVVLAVNLAPLRTFGGQQVEQLHLSVGNRLDAGASDVAVDPKGRETVRRVLAPRLKGECLRLGGAYEHKLGDYGADRAGASVGAPDRLLRKVDRMAQRAEAALCLEYPGRFYSIPMCGIVHPLDLILSAVSDYGGFAGRTSAVYSGYSNVALGGEGRIPVSPPGPPRLWGRSPSAGTDPSANPVRRDTWSRRGGFGHPPSPNTWAPAVAVGP